MAKCIQCGYNNDPTAATCGLCGSKLMSVRTGERKLGASSAVIHEPRLWQAGKPRARAERTEAAREASRTDIERHFVVPPVGDPLKLEPGTPVVIGREDGCDIRLLSTNVSRRHAEIRWTDDPPRPTIRDLGSQNGTQVNGIKIERTEQGLSDGDRLQIGDLQATYRCLAVGVPDSSLHEDVSGESTSVMEAPTSSLDNAAIEAAGLTGDASILPIPEVLKRLAVLRAWGKLHVEAGGAKGFLLLEDGRPANASYAGLEGLPAVAAISSLATGRFRFEQTERPRIAERPTQPLDAAKLRPNVPTQKIAPPPPPRPGAPPPPPRKPGGPT